MREGSVSPGSAGALWVPGAVCGAGETASVSFTKGSIQPCCCSAAFRREGGCRGGAEAASSSLHRSSGGFLGLS